MLTRIVACLAVVAAAFTPARADEEALERAFVGQPVQVLTDLPATTSGLDFHPDLRDPTDQTEHQKRLLQSGVGVRRGDVVVVTKIKVKKKHVEFQLGAGGQSQLPSRPSSYVPTSKLEQELEDQIKKASSEAEKKRLRAELAEERDRRDRERRRREARAEEQYQQALSAHSPEEWALLAGSRINVRFEDQVPGGALTPDGFTRVLKGVINFRPPAEALAARDQAAGDVLGASVLPVHKGQRRNELDDHFGPPESCSRGTQSGLKVDVCTYDLDEAALEASFVDGVLVRYVIKSN
jgi:hypothetical protein